MDIAHSPGLEGIFSNAYFNLFTPRGVWRDYLPPVDEMLWCYHSNEPLRQNFCEVLFHSWDFTKRNLNCLLELLTTRKTERVNVIPSYKPRLQASTIWPWMVWISGQILSTYFFTSWTEHVHTTEKIHKIKAQFQTQFCLAILKLNIDLSTVGEKKNSNVHSGAYHFAKKIIENFEREVT